MWACHTKVTRITGTIKQIEIKIKVFIDHKMKLIMVRYPSNIRLHGTKTYLGPEIPVLCPLGWGAGGLTKVRSIYYSISPSSYRWRSLSMSLIVGA
jgi:hypothetical protein